MEGKPDWSWIDRLDPIRKARARGHEDTLVGWLCPEATVFVICVVFCLGMGATVLTSKTFFTDPEITLPFTNGGWFPTAYRGIDPANGFQKPEDLIVPFRFPKYFPLNPSWIYSKKYRDAEAARDKWHLVRKKKWEEIDRPKLLKQIEEMEAQLALQQQQQAEAQMDEPQEMEPTSSVAAE